MPPRFRKFLLSRPQGVFEAYGASFLRLSLPRGWQGVVHLGTTTTAAEVRQSSEAWTQSLVPFCGDLTQRADFKVLKYAPTSRTYRVEIAAPSGHAKAVCKVRRTERWAQRIAACWSGPKLWREFWWGHALHQLHIATPLPLAVLFQWDEDYRVESRLLCTYVDDARALDQALREISVSASHDHGDRFAILIERTVDLLISLGEQRFYHRDLKASNIVVTGLAHDPQPRLIDLDGVGRERSGFGPKFRSSIVRLASSLSDIQGVTNTARLRALKRLCSGRSAFGKPSAARRPCRPSWKSEWHHIERDIERRAGRRYRDAGKLASYE